MNSQICSDIFKAPISWYFAWYRRLSSCWAWRTTSTLESTMWGEDVAWSGTLVTQYSNIRPMIDHWNYYHEYIYYKLISNLLIIHATGNRVFVQYSQYSTSRLLDLARSPCHTAKDWAKTQATRLRCLGTHLVDIARATPNSRLARWKLTIRTIQCFDILSIWFF